jgi:hypothetical protein
VLSPMGGGGGGQLCTEARAGAGKRQVQQGTVLGVKAVPVVGAHAFNSVLG